MSLGANDADCCLIKSSMALAGTVADVTTSVNSLVYSLYIRNTVAAVSYLQVFNKQSASVTLGTTAADWVIPVAASSALTLVFDSPVRHDVGLSWASTSTATGSTGAAQDVVITYKQGA